jgi:hypothetical protein
MATLVLSAVGAAVGSGFGGSVLGLSGMIIGRAVGATVGRVIDQRLMGGGSQAVETGRMDRLRVSGASEGAPVPLVWGRVRLGGQVIWASDFRETVTTTGGGGKIVKKPTVTDFSYSVSVAMALCEGPILGIGRIWADGQELVAGDLNIRVYRGDEVQLPDPLIVAIEGAGAAPAYRGIAYVVIEDLPLGEFGNRVPQFSFEVMRAVATDDPQSLSDMIRAVALMPGSGDVALATSPVYSSDSSGERALNLNSATGQTDMLAALDALGRELPRVASGLLIVSWFGSDLRAGNCIIEPKIEEAARQIPALPWSVAGRAASNTPEVLKRGGRAVYGGTPSDASVVQAIAAMKARGLDVVYYPFILMDQTADQALPDPWSDGVQQDLPWRGRITLSKATGQPDSPDGTAAADAQVVAFFGTAQRSHFSIGAGSVTYSGPNEWRYRRFILHQAALCAAAGGVDAFCIGSEMRGLTTIRGVAHSFPAVAALRALAADVRAILGPQTKITYAADWSEYFGLITPNGDRFFHLDPLWADDNIDAIAIDNYMPLSDWRDGDNHLDAPAGDVHALDYLTANVAGGEGFDWFYANDQDRAQQIRTPITDNTEWSEPWIWRYKDLRGWWENDHHDRVGGARAAQPTAWVPRSKPIWFTEYGCAAIDRGTNQPNVFLDPKSSESFIPYSSRGGRDDAIQMQYFRAVHRHWSDPANNPVSEVYGGHMVDIARAHAWAWDTRPYPWFPGNLALWSDGENWARGHWLTGRATGQPLDALIVEICARAGVMDVDVTGVWGVVRGFAVPSTDSPRAQLQSLMLAYGVEVAERDGRLTFVMRAGRADAVLTRDNLVRDDGGDLTLIRVPEAEVAGRIRLSYVAEGGAFDLRVAEAVFPDQSAAQSSGSDVPLVLTGAEARAIAERWLAESRVARDTARFALPPSSPLGAGDVVAFADSDAGAGLWRIDRTTLSTAREVEATRIDPAVYGAPQNTTDNGPPVVYVPPEPVQPVFLDLPLFLSDADPQAPWLALNASAWPGAVAVHRITQGSEFVLDALVSRPATLGVTQTPLPAAPIGRWDNGPAVRVQMTGALASAPRAAVLGGANLLAIGTGAGWEILQFADAELVGPDLYDLRTRLRGQFGTDADMAPEWPAGAQVVLLDTAVTRLPLSLDAVGLSRLYRIGPLNRPLDDPAQRDVQTSFGGVGLRPYRPVHLRARVVDGDLAVSWLRRTRWGGDGWNSVDVPLGEEREAYVLRVSKDGALLRDVALDAPHWTYTAALQTADGAGGSFTLSVAQLSATYGAGPFATLQVGV